MDISNTEKEMAWIDAWNDFYDLLETNFNGFILLPDFQESSVEDAKGWIQDTVYSGFLVKFTVDYYKGKKSLFVHKVVLEIAEV